MRSIKTHILIPLSLICLSSNLQGQTKLTVQEALEDIDWLQNALKYVHPRLYKYTEKEVLDSIFNEVRVHVGDSQENILGLDFLSEVSKINASVNCGHLYTIPQFELHEEVIRKKVMPFYIKVLQDELFIVNDLSEKRQLNGVKILSINDNSSVDILQNIKLGIATDGHIETRKNRLIERYFFYAFHGFDLYYHLHIDRSEKFRIEYQKSGDDRIYRVDLNGISIEERTYRLNEIYRTDERQWHNTPSPKFEVSTEENYAILTVSRSFYDKEVDPDFDLFLKNSFQEQRNL